MDDQLSAIFSDQKRAEQNLRKLVSNALTRELVERLLPNLFSFLKECPDPDMALTNLVRFSEASFSRSNLYRLLLRGPSLLKSLLMVFSTSQYLSDILIRDPYYFPWIMETLCNPIDELYNNCINTLESFRSISSKLSCLRRFKRRELLRIGLRDILGLTTLQTTIRELSDLADLIIDLTYNIHWGYYVEKYGRPKARFAILGLGKLGGRELNYSSDVDLLFVYSEEGKIEGTNITYHNFFNRLAEDIVVSLSGGGEALYRVDTRLRPDGESGPLARSLTSYLKHYEIRGQIWERQMLIKARPVAGSKSLGEEFIRSLQAFIYPKTHFHTPLEDIARIKARIEDGSGRGNVKLRAGGIRDIEFIVQALQLINGGTNPQICSGNTLEALTQLKRAGLLSSEETGILKEAYVFHRRLEHRLQMMHCLRTFTLPSSCEELNKLAKRLGLKDEIELSAKLDHLSKQVRRIFEQVFLPKRESGSDLGILLEGGPQNPHVRRILQDFNFRDVGSSLRNLRYLAYGHAPKFLSSKAKESLLRLLPPLLEEMKSTPDPDLTLSNLETVVSSYQAFESFYQIMEDNPSFRRMLIRICGLSSRFSRILSQNPIYLEALTVAGILEERFNKDKSVEVLNSTTQEPNKIGKFKDFEALRIGTRNLLGLSSLEEMQEELTELAELILGEVYNLLLKGFREALGEKEPDFAILGLGKLGGRELNFDSDLDLILLYSTEKHKTSAQKLFSQLSQKLISTLTQPAFGRKIYNIDLRLRPEGEGSPAVIPVDGYFKYLRERASLWERQSLIKARFLVGNKTLGKRIMGKIENFVYGKGLTAPELKDILLMRRKIEKERLGRSFDIKFGRGGMMDVEFLVQIYQLRYGGEIPQLRCPSTLRVLEELKSCSLFESEICSQLRESYLFWRQIEKHLQISLEKRSTKLPTDRSRLDYLGRCLGYRDGGEFSGVVKEIADNTRETFEKMAILDY